MTEAMKGLGDPIEDLENVNIPGMKKEIVKEEICEEELPDLPNYVTIKNEVVIDKLDIEMKQEVHKMHSEVQLAKNEHLDEDSGETEPLSPLKIKTECEFEEFDQPDQIPVEDIDSILFEGTKIKVKSEFGSPEDPNEPTDEVSEKDSTSKPSSIKLFKCEVCSKGFASEPVKNRHMRIHFAKGPVPCTMCGKEFDERTSYIQHYGIHFEEQYQFHCLVCYKKFPSQPDLDEHRTSHHNTLPKLEPDGPSVGQKRYPCRYCSKDFPNRSDLLGHESLHNGKQLSQCSICLKNFTKAFELNKHMRSHTGCRPFSCELCSKSYAQRGALTVHQKIAHSDEKTFRCNVCPRIFAYNSSLRRHLRNHRGERPHKCPECFKTFTSKYSLEEHVTIHTGEQPFSCPVCHKKFRRPWYLKRHYYLVHSSALGETRRLQCGSCDKTFASKENLKRHETWHDGAGPFKCVPCSKSFKYEINLEKHKATHDPARVVERPFDCHLCSRMFTTKYRRDTHVESHPKEPLQCEMCDKRFEKKEGLRLHQRVHSEERYSCEVCSRAFRCSRNLKRHMVTHLEVDEGVV